MWKKIVKYFDKYPKRKKLAQKLIEYGLSVKNGKIYCDQIELSNSKIARALKFDRRIINSTIQTIEEKRDLEKIYKKLKPTCHLKYVAEMMNWSVIEIIPKDPSIPGIIAGVTKIFADGNISVRQAIVDDYELSEEPRLFIITEQTIKGQYIPKIRNVKGVKAVLIH
jgi:predicted regulator of amino acid metabolism with ACT domain